VTDIRTIRDEIAGMMGQGWVESEGCYDSIDGCHPVPSTLDGIAALWPKGWEWQRLCDGGWVASKTRKIDDFIEVPDTGDELADRTRLLHAVLRAEMDAAKPSP